MKIILTIDNTASMGQSTTSAKTSVEEIRTMVALILGQASVKISVYGDYDSSTPDSCCGGWSILKETADLDTRQIWLNKYMKPCGGGGCPEAQRTAFNHLYREEEDRCIIFHFTDAPPHLSSKLDKEGKKEELYLSKHLMETDWDRLCELTKKKHRVVTFLTTKNNELVNLYSKMGEVVVVERNSSTIITSTMMTVLMQLIGQPSEKTITYSTTDPNTSQVITSESTQVEIPINLEDIMASMNPLVVIKAFEELLNPKKPNQAVCLATNKILGKYWRLICGKYRLIDDGKYESRAQNVMDKLSECKTKMDQNNQQVMKQWIDESHDDTSVIRKMVVDALPSCTSVLVLRGDPQISLDELLALGRGGGNFRELSKLLSTLEEVPLVECALPEDPDESPGFIPLQGMRLISVFRQIANLIKPGIMFSASTAMLAAILSLPNKHMSKLAKALLKERKGKWIDFSLDDSGAPNFPTNYAINFIRILNLLHGEYLTEKELEFRDHYILIEKVLRNHDSMITVVTGLIQKETRLDLTWKRTCRDCNQPRCFTIFPGNSKFCGICLNFNDPTAVSVVKERGVTTCDVIEGTLDKTNWAQCRTCKANYGVTKIEDLNVQPKCYYCRAGEACPTVECHLCHHKFVDEAMAAENAMHIALGEAHENTEQYQRLKRAKSSGLFVCPRCVYDPKSMIQESEVKLADILGENSALRALVPVKEYDILVDKSLKLWKRVIAVHSKIVKEDSDRPPYLSYKGFTVHDPVQVSTAFKQKILNAESKVACCMCVEETPLHLMMDACGQCSNRICNKCVQGWYGQVVAGSVVSQSNTVCPFCKAPPKYAVVRNFAQAHLRNIRPSQKSDRDMCQWDPRIWYAACTRCLMVKPAVGRDCAGEPPPLQNFMCNECETAQHTLTNAAVSQAVSASLIIQQCPGCGVEVEKNGGCNHIACSLCPEHWCWGCGMGGFDNHSVYDHMSNCKGIFQN